MCESGSCVQMFSYVCIFSYFDVWMMLMLICADFWFVCTIVCAIDIFSDSDV